jgi:hypothetical protein
MVLDIFLQPDSATTSSVSGWLCAERSCGLSPPSSTGAASAQTCNQADNCNRQSTQPDNSISLCHCMLKRNLCFATACSNGIFVLPLHAQTDSLQTMGGFILPSRRVMHSDKLCSCQMSTKREGDTTTKTKTCYDLKPPTSSEANHARGSAKNWTSSETGHLR